MVDSIKHQQKQSGNGKKPVASVAALGVSFSLITYESSTIPRMAARAKNAMDV